LLGKGEAGIHHLAGGGRADLLALDIDGLGCGFEGEAARKERGDGDKRLTQGSSLLKL